MPTSPRGQNFRLALGPPDPQCCPLNKKFIGEFLQIIYLAPTTQSILTMRNSAVAIKKYTQLQNIQISERSQDHLHNYGN